jgi:iron complex outermembrane receptor protein
MNPHTNKPHVPLLFRHIRLLLCGVGLAFSCLYAQSDQPAVKTDDEIVQLPKFTIDSELDDSFIGKEAMSTTRTGVALSNLAQSVAVVNKQFINDIKPAYIADIMKYIGGGQTGTLTWTGSTRYMMRGFTSEGDFMDGFKMPSGNTSFNYVDHIEVIKGPSAIFVTNSANTVGGMVNKVSKSPTRYRVGEVTIEAGLWDRGGANLDVGGPITQDGKLQYRMLLSGTDYPRYYDRSHDDRWSIMPMIAYDFSADTRIWIKAERHGHNYSAYEGVPLDGRTNQVALGRKGNLHEDSPLNYRKDSFTRVWGQFTTRPSDFLAIRFAGLAYTALQSRVQSITSPSGAVTPSLQPDGSWIFAPYAQYTIPPNYVAGQLIPRSTTAEIVAQPARELQNDYVFTFDTGPARHTLLVGGVVREDVSTRLNYSSGSTSTATSSPIDPFNPAFPGTVFVNWDQPPVNRLEQNNLFFKGFVLDTVSFMKNRIILTYGVSRSRFAQSSSSVSYNQKTGVTSAAQSVPETILSKNLTQYSLLVKPLPNVSVFYGSNVNFAANPIQFGQFLPPQEGKQWELGVKSEWMDGRLSVSASYFNIEQINNNVQPFPQTVPASFILTPGVHSKGIDGDIAFAVNDNRSFIASFALFDATSAMREPWSLAPQPYDGKIYSVLPVNNVSERNFALWSRYKFTKGALQGLSIGVGVSNLSKRAITDNANQVFYGYIPGYTLVDATINYTTKRFLYQLRIDNVLNDSDYIHAARSNQVIVPGSPTNIGGSITYKF